MECCGGSAAGLENQMSKPQAPTPPDFVGAAQQTGQSNVVAAIIQRLMGQTGSNTPWGSLRWDQTGTQHIGPGGIGSTSTAPAPSGTSPTPMAGFDLGGLDPVGNQLSNRTGDPLGIYGPSSPFLGKGSQSSGAPGSTPGMPNFDIPTFTSTVTLSPEQQAIFNQQQQNLRGSATAAGQLISGLNTSPIDDSGMPQRPSGDQLNQTRQNVADAIYG